MFAGWKAGQLTARRKWFRSHEI